MPMARCLHFPLLINLALWIKGGLQTRRLLREARRPRLASEHTLRDILSISKDTVFGKEHHFDEILATSTDSELFAMYQHLVPVNDYEALRPYVERHKNGETGILFPGRPEMYATTSGTTSAPKWVPMTRKYLRDVYGKMSNVWVWNFIKHRKMALSGKVFAIVGKECEGYAPDGTLYGSVSGVLVRDLPPIIKKRYTAPASVMSIEDYAARNYTLMRLAIQHWDVTLWSTANPSTILELQRAVDNGGRILPRDYWKKLQILSTWKCGNTKVYMDKYLDYFDFEQTCYQELGYIATECRFGFALDMSNESVLFPHLHYYEFVPEEDMDKPHKRFLQVDELEQGKRYCTYVTTYSGLFRYNMNDLVEVGGMYEKTPTIHMVGKVNGIVSLTGEKLYEPQFIEAVHQAEEETKIKTKFFVGFADVNESDYHFYFEFADEETTQETADMFANVVDEKLRAINIEYESKRASFRLNAPIAHRLQKNAYARFKSACLEDGMRDGQFKFNLLMQDEKRREKFQVLILGDKLSNIRRNAMVRRSERDDRRSERTKRRQSRKEKRIKKKD